MHAAIVVPWRGGDDRREAIWVYTRAWWERLGYDLIQVTHEGTEPFSRGWCLNEGARRAAPWDVLVMIDADVVCDDESQVVHAIGTAYSTGRLTMAHTEGRDINDAGTRRLLEGWGAFDWNDYLEASRPGCTSRVQAIRSDLFEKLGGFDERFTGWGHEDVAFEHAAKLAAGDFERIDGVTWHLHHQPQLRRSQPTKEWQAGKQLANRYLKAKTWSQVRKVLDERTPPQRYEPPLGDVRIVNDAEAELVVMTSGRRDYLLEAVASFDANVVGRITERTIYDDSGDPDYAAWLDGEFGDRFKICHNERNLGFTAAVGKAMADVAARPGPDYVFWLEDDFTFRRPFVIDDLATILENDQLAQVGLLRAPYYPKELQAGSIPNEHPESYHPRRAGELRYLKHDRFFTTNPSLIPRSLFAAHPWPTGAHSESRHGRGLRGAGLGFAYLGDGEPWTDHIGAVRGGHGY
jgi:GT2 family glycosyltransferase